MGVYMCVGKSAHMLGGYVSGAASQIASIGKHTMRVCVCVCVATL